MRLSFGLFVTAVTAQTISQVLSDIQLITSDTVNLTMQLQGPLNMQTVGNVEIAALNLNSDTGKAATDAKAVPAPVSEADQVSVLQAIESLYPDVIAALAAYVPVKAKLDQLIGAGTPETLLMSIQSSADVLAGALIAKATGPYVAIGQTLQTDIDNAFKSALAGTVPTAVGLPTIPPAGGSTTTSSSGPMTTSSGSPPPTTVTSSQSVYVSSSPSVYVSSSPPVYVSSSPSVYVSSGAPVYGSSSVPVYGSSSVPVYGSSSVPVYGSSSVPVYGSSSVPVYASSSVPVYVTSTVVPPSGGTTPPPSGPAAPQFTGEAGRAAAKMGVVALAAGLAIIL